LKSSYPSPAASVPKPGRRAGKEQTFKPRPEANLAELLSKLLIYIYIYVCVCVYYIINNHQISNT
jgi:uncharacterized membrane protein